MRRHIFAAVLVLGLIAVVAGVASANPWPSYDALKGEFPTDITATKVAGQGWNYTVTVDPGDEYPGWGIKAFVVYVTGLTSQPSDQYVYDGGNTAGWTNLNGGWETGKFSGDQASEGTFGWQTGSDYIMSGGSATFYARNLPAGWENWTEDNVYFVVHAVPPDGVNTFWTQGNFHQEGGRVPEPGSLALLTLGLGAVTGVIRRRRSS